MLNLKRKRLLVVLVFLCWSVPAFGVFDAQLGSLGFALPFRCSVVAKSNTDYSPKTCYGYRVDYVSPPNFVLANEQLFIRFGDSFLNKYAQESWLFGYRFDFGDLTKFFSDQPVAVLSSVHLTLLYVLKVGSFSEEHLNTADYHAIMEGGPNQRIELGWRINPSWDVFVSRYTVEVGPFAVKKKETIEKDTLKIEVFYLGAHYTY